MDANKPRPAHPPDLKPSLPSGIARAGATLQRLATPLWAAVLAVTLVGAFLRFFMLGHQGLWYDESFTSSLMRFSPGKMLGLLPTEESTPPLYYCVVWIWSHVFGNTNWGLRSLSALCGTLTIPAVFLAAQKLLANRRAALIVAALAACNPLLIWYSQEARAYSMLVLWCAVGLAAFAYAVERPDRLRLAVWALSSILALTTHYYAALLLVPEAIWLLRVHGKRISAWIAVAAVTAGGLALLPLLLAQTNAANYLWIARMPLSVRLGQILPMALIGTGAPIRETLKFIAFAAALVGLGLLAIRARRSERRQAMLAGGIVGAGCLIALAGVLVSDTLLARNLLPLWIPAAILLGAGLGAERARTLGLGAAATLCVVGVVAVIGIDTTYGLQRPNWRPVAASLGPPPAHGHARLVVVQRLPALLPIGLYMPGLRRAPRRPLVHLTEIDVIAQRSPLPGGHCWWGSACNLPASRLRHSYPIAGFHPLHPAQQVEQFHVLRLVAATPQTVTMTALARALHTTDLHHDGLLIQR